MSDSRGYIGNAPQYLPTPLTSDGSGNVSGVGSLSFTGTGNRITGDFSNATIANRVMFQTSTVNGATTPALIPNGSAASSGITAFNNSNPTNAAFGAVLATATDTQLLSGITGTGTYLPMTFYTGGSERVRIDTSGNVGIGTGGAIATTLDQAGTVRPFTFEGASTSTTVADGSGGMSIVNGQTTTNNFSSIAFSASTGANANYYTSGLIQVQHGARVNGQYHSGNMIFSTSAGSNTAPVERMRIDSSGNVGIGVTPTSKMQVKVATDINLAVSTNVAYTGAVSINAINDANLANVPLEIRATETHFTTGGALVTGLGGLGYGTGSGGSVTQGAGSGKSTLVTLHKTNGQITMNGAALAANTGVTFQLSNSTIAATDCVIVNMTGVAGSQYNLWASDITSNSCQIQLRNITGGSLSEAVKINFAVIKAAIT